MMNSKQTFVSLEITALICITLFCVGSWHTKPQSVFSLQDALRNNHSALLLQTELVSVNLPSSFAKHFQSSQLQALRLTNNAPNWMPSQLSTESITVNLSQCINGNDSHLLIINLLSLHQQPTSYQIRIVSQNGKLLHQQSSGLLPAGEMMWRGQTGKIDLAQSPLMHITTDQSGSKAFLCDVTIYDAPGMKFWDRGDG